jgi:capsular polysaccharide biosynthesis protein
MTKKLFLLRGNVGSHNKRDYNEKEIYTYLQSKGYIGVKVEEYSFLEQVFLFNNADYIIGPSGAFWTNLIFCKAGVKAISWLPKKVSEFSVYSTIANYFGVEMKFIFSKSLDGNLHGRYSISISDLLKTLDSEQVSV